MAERDRELLREFVEDVYHLLEQQAVGGRFVPESLQGEFLAAWQELSIYEVNRWLAVPSSDDALEVAGLTGASLAVKLHGYELARAEFMRRPVVYLLRRLLRWADVILGSLAAVFPPAEALKELKEVLEAALEDESDERSRRSGWRR